MNRFSIGKERTAKIVQSRELAQEEIVYYGSDKVDGVGRTSSYIDRLYANSIADSLVTTRIRISSLDSAKGSTGTYSNCSSGLLADVVGDLQEGATSNLSIGPILSIVFFSNAW